MSKHVVASVEELPPGSRKLVEIKGRPIAIFNIAGEFFGVFNRCPHEGGPLCHGTLTGLLTAPEPGQYQFLRKGEILRCPWHGWEYDIRTGQSYCDAENIRTKKYDVMVVDGVEVAKGPYVAETIPVTVENQYIVVEV